MAGKSERGPILQLIFEAQEDADNSGSPYLLIQRQFEDLEDDLCYVETHDEKYIGHFILHRVEFTLHGLSIELDRPADNLLSVTCAFRFQRGVVGHEDHLR